MIDLEFRNDADLTYDIIISKFKAYADRRMLEFSSLFSSETGLPIRQLQPSESIEYFRDLCLFPSPELIHMFQSIGLKEERLQWFISLEEVVHEIEKINLRNIIKVDRPSAVFSLIYYIQSKAAGLGTSEWFEYKKIPNKKAFRKNHLLSKEYDRIKKNLKDRKVYKEDEQQIIFDMLDKMQLAFGKALSHSIVDALLGNPEKAFLQPFYKHNVVGQSPGVKKSQVFRELYDLIQLIAKDENLPHSSILYANNYESKLALQGYGSPSRFIATRLGRLLLGR